MAPPAEDDLPWRSALGCLTALELLLSLVVFPIGVVLVAIGDQKGWYGVAAPFVMGAYVLFERRRRPDKKVPPLV